MKRKMNYTTTLILLLLVAAGTYYNAKRQPVEVVSNPDPVMNEWESYFKDNKWDSITTLDIELWFLKGSTVDELGNPNEYNIGGYLLTDNPVAPTGKFTMIWQPLDVFEDWETEVEKIVKTSGEDISYDAESFIELQYPTQQEHMAVLLFLNGTGSMSEDYVGIFSGQLCEETDRVIITMYYDKTSFDINSPVNNGAAFNVAYECHPIEGSPIQIFRGED